MIWPKLLFGLAVLLAPCLSNPVFVSQAEEEDTYDYQGYRLPDHQEPINYEAQIFIDENNLNGNSLVFEGKAIITFRLNQNSDQVQLHTENLNINSVNINTNSTSSTLGVISYDTFNETSNIRTVRFNSNLEANRIYNLTFVYTGLLDNSDVMRGPYLSSYKNENGETEYLVTTQFEPVHARKAFPCFDEPQYKATFNLTLQYPMGYTARSNTPAGTARSINNVYESVTFQKTPVMSTYLIAFIVSRFNCTQGENMGTNVPFNVCSRRESVADRELAVQLGPPILKALDSFTGIPYESHNMGKMDVLAIPDFAAGAMENWGIVTYRETALLWDSTESSNYYKQRVATVIAHEFSHMWFGNLVTMKWWDYTFLNEGFARYLQYYAAANTQELATWELNKQFPIEQLQVVMVTDSSSSADALTSKASTPTEISEKFGTISYNKGGSIFRMVHHFMGNENFQQGIQRYLQDRKSNNAEPSHLWTALSQFVPQELPLDGNLSDIMDNWINHGGFPLITATAKGNDVILSQKRFFLSSSASSDVEWYVPISYTVSANTAGFEDTAPKAWLIPGSNLTLSNVLTGSEWIILNNQETAYYRVNYDDTLWKSIKTALINYPSSIDVINRAQIVDDAFNLARAGILKYSRALEIVSYLKSETEYYPWYAANRGFTHLLNRLGYDSSEQGSKVVSFALDMIQEVFNSVSFDKTNENDQIYSLKLAMILKTACKLGESKCINQARKLYSQFKTNNTPIDKNLRAVVYCNALRYSENQESDWNFLWQRYQSTSLSSEQVTIITALGCTRNATLLEKYLTYSIDSNSGIRKQDFSSVWSGVYSSGQEGATAALEFIINHYKSLSEHYSSTSSLVTSIASYLTSDSQLLLLETLISIVDVPEAIKTAAQSGLTSASNNIEWAKGKETELIEYFSSANIDEVYGGYRLPEYQSPINYTVNLILTESNFDGSSTDFTGQVVIAFNLTQSSRVIRIHSGVDVQTIKLVASDSSEISLLNFSEYNSTTEILTITASQTILAKEIYYLTITFNGELDTTDMQGFYLSTYADSTGKTQYLATTQFQPTHARKAFPCFDEPQYKAVFVVTIQYPRGYNALGNMAPGTPTIIDNVYESVTFPKTPVMSTYLVAFTISKFTCTSGNQLGGSLPYQVCSRNESRADRDLAVRLGPPLIKALENYTGITYESQGVGKLDQLAIPDFDAGAMENWGIVTFRETALLWNNNESSNYYKQRVATVIAHEFTHMWFGNLVTMKWWDYTFLNEGFARHFQYFAAATIDELASWELDKQFVIEQLQTILVSDSVTSSKALASVAASPSQVSGKFGTISYNKGASVFRMVRCFFGDDKFQSGIRLYLNDRKSNYSEPSHLWTALSNFLPSGLPNVDLDTIMDSWINKAGFPLITVTANSNNITLSQKRFLYSGSSDTEWYVPISYTVSANTADFNSTTPKTWMLPGSNLTLENALADSTWIILNNQQSSYYRIHYDSFLRGRIRTALLNGHSSFDVLNRAQIVDDAFNLARGGVLKYSETFDLVSYLANETDYYPWYSANTGFNFLLNRIGYDSVSGSKVVSYFINLMERVYNSVPFDQLDENDQVYTLKQVMILTRACKLGESGCVSAVKNLYSQFKNDESAIDKNLKTIVYCNALRYSDNDESDWNFLWQRYQSTTLSSEQVTIISALGCTKNATLLAKYMDLSINSTSGIRLQDFSSVWSGIYGSSAEGANAAMLYIINNYQKLSEYYSSVNSLITGIASYFTTAEQCTLLETLAALEDISTSTKSACESALASARANINWAESLEQDLLSYFEEATSTTSSSTTVSPTTTVYSTTTVTSTTTEAPDGAGNAFASFTLIVIAVVLNKFII